MPPLPRPPTQPSLPTAPQELPPPAGLWGPLPACAAVAASPPRRQGTLIAVAEAGPELATAVTTGPCRRDGAQSRGVAGLGSPAGYMLVSVPSGWRCPGG